MHYLCTFSCLFLCGTGSRMLLWLLLWSISFVMGKLVVEMWINGVVENILALPFTLKSISRQKKNNYGNSNISPCENITFKNSSKRNQNPSRYYNSITTNLKCQHQAKTSSFKHPHIIKIDLLLLPRGQNPLSYLPILYNESKHIVKGYFNYISTNNPQVSC